MSALRGYHEFAALPRRDAPLLSIAYQILLAGFLFVSFVGLSALTGGVSADDRADGNPLQKITIIGLFALSLLVLWQRRSATIACIRGNAVILGIIVFCVLSTLWSDYPALTLRRSMLLVMTTTIALGVAVGSTGLRNFHTSLFLFLTGVVALNFVAVVLWPGSAISDIGVKGVYTDKNSAGQVGMIAVVVGAVWLLGTRKTSTALAGLACVALAFLFLAVTKSKTSIALTIVALAVGALLVMSDRLGRQFVLLTWSGALLVAIFLVGLLFWNNFEVDQTLATFVPDTSFSARDSIWEFAWQAASKRMWLGHGYGAFWDVGLANDPLAKLEPGTWLGDVQIGVINEAHNGYLDLWLQVGLPVTLLASAVILIGMIFDFRRFVDIAASQEVKSACLAMGLIMLVYLLHNVTESTLFNRGTSLYNLTIVMRFLATLGDAGHSGNKPAGR